MIDTADTTTELARGKSTDEMLDGMGSRIGLEPRTGARVNNEYATRLAILRFCGGIGDDDPLCTDPAYAAAHGTPIAPLGFIFACLPPVQFGWTGLGGLHAGRKLAFRRSNRLIDEITARVSFGGEIGRAAEQPDAPCRLGAASARPASGLRRTHGPGARRAVRPRRRRAGRTPRGGGDRRMTSLAALGTADRFLRGNPRPVQDRSDLPGVLGKAW